MQDGAIRHGQNVIIVDDLIATGACAYILIDMLLSLHPSQVAPPVQRVPLFVCKAGTSWSTCLLWRYLHCESTGPLRTLFIRSSKNKCASGALKPYYVYCWAPPALFKSVVGPR